MKNIQVTLHSDGSDAELGFWYTGDNYFALVLSDDGGYSSIVVNKKDWENIKVQVDELVKEHIND